MLSNELTAEPESTVKTSPATPRWRAAAQLSWLGQMIASGCWIISVFAYGVSSAGDVMQLVAASAWMVANVATLYESAS